MKLHAPLLPLAISLIIGITLGGYLDNWSKGFYYLTPLLLISCLLRRFPRCQTVGIWGCTLVLGAMLSSMRGQQLKTKWPQELIYQEVVVTSEPVIKEKVVTFDALTAQHHRKIKCRIVRDEASEHITIGEGIQILSKVTPIHQWRQNHFDYQHYMQCHNFAGETFIRKGYWQPRAVSLEGFPQIEKARLRLLRLRHRLLLHYQQWELGSQVYGIIAAMTLGDKSQIDTELRDIYSRVGAAHVLALSGMHLMIIYAVVTLFVGWWRFRTLSQMITVLAIWFFAFLTGLSPSIMRAAFMITVYALLSLGYRERMSVNTLAFTAIIMLVINPFALYDIGFQLSFAAVLAIVLINPLFTTIIPLPVLQRHRWLNVFWGLTTVSLAAQIGTAPLVAYYFGRFSTYFLLSNYLVVPLTTIILYLTLTCMVVFWWSSLQQLLVMSLSTIVSLMNLLLSHIAVLPHSSIENIHLTTLQLYLIYIFIGCMWVIGSLYRKNVQNLTKC